MQSWIGLLVCLLIFLFQTHVERVRRGQTGVVGGAVLEPSIFENLITKSCPSMKMGSLENFQLYGNTLQKAQKVYQGKVLGYLHLMDLIS